MVYIRSVGPAYGGGPSDSLLVCTEPTTPRIQPSPGAYVHIRSHPQRLTADAKENLRNGPLESIDTWTSIDARTCEDVCMGLDMFRVTQLRTRRRGTKRQGNQDVTQNQRKTRSRARIQRDKPHVHTGLRPAYKTNT